MILPIIGRHLLCLIELMYGVMAKFQFLLLAIIINVIPCVAQDVARIQNAILQLQTLSESSLNNVHIGNMEQAVQDYAKIMSIIERSDADTLSVWLPFYVDDGIHEPVIRYLVHINHEDVLKACDFYLNLQNKKISFWYEDGQIHTRESFISNVSFQYTKLAHWLTEEGLYGKAEECHLNAIRIFENAEVYSHEYADELWDMADFQQLYKNDCLESLRYHYRSFNVLVELYGIESPDAIEAFYRMSNVYGMAIPGISAVYTDIPEYEKGKEILNFWRCICAEVKEKYGDNTLSDIFKRLWEKRMVPPKSNLSFKNLVDSIRYDMLPVRSYDAEMARTYCNEALLNMIYKDNEGFLNSVLQIFSIHLSEDEYVAYIVALSSYLDEFNYVDKAMEVLAGGIGILSKQSKRMDLIEYVSSILAPMASRYQNKLYFTISAICIYPLLTHGQIHYYDIENYLTIVCAALQYYHSDQEISDCLCQAADSLIILHDNVISNHIKQVANARIAYIQREMGNEHEALEYLKKSIYWQQLYISELCEWQWDKEPESPMWPVSAFEELAILYGRCHDYKNEKTVLENCLKHYERNDPYNIGLRTVYSELVWIADKMKDMPAYEKYASRWLVSEINAYMSHSFSMLKKDRISYFYGTSLPFISEAIAYASLNNANLVGKCYDVTLALKGFLLNQELTISRNTLGSNDPVFLEVYEKYTEALMSGDPDVDKYESAFMQQYFLHPEFRDSFSMPSWRDVANALEKDDIAIEFVVGRSLDQDSEIYAALLLKKGWDSPLLVKLADKKTIERLYASGTDIYKPGAYAYSVIWGTIEPFLKGVKTIYFSAYGALCQMNIEVMSNEKGIPLNRKYEIHRLSSTSLLCKYGAGGDEDYDSALLFGGLNYNTDTSYLKEQNELYSRRPNISEFTDLNMHNRAGWGYLEGTKEEVERIKEIMTDNVKVELYEEDEGTESVFKSYNGRGPSIIHIATHGFYLDQKEARREPMFESDSEYPQYIEPMKRSGLMLSGGQHAWLGNLIPEGIEDGILTAKEVSGMNLLGTELLVLSACETGLGDVTGEGVYGLQRGFKLAGVETIIMSLWKVNDDMTKLLMSTFYASLMDGKSKYKSFQNAVDKVRKENDNPEYWAAFIMLD